MENEQDLIEEEKAYAAKVIANKNVLEDSIKKKYKIVICPPLIKEDLYILWLSCYVEKYFLMKHEQIIEDLNKGDKTYFQIINRILDFDGVMISAYKPDFTIEQRLQLEKLRSEFLIRNYVDCKILDPDPKNSPIIIPK